ncbi:hypothetical protein HAX54_015784, partial [Datura stramonium]|nr:hypothetical protein [Datura stramonium]
MDLQPSETQIQLDPAELADVVEVVHVELVDVVEPINDDGMTAVANKLKVEVEFTQDLNIVPIE